MRKAFLFGLVLFFSICTQAQDMRRPKLVVGIVIDQMRWDYLYRYNDVFKTTGGFKRLLNQGFSCENTFIPYTPTVTAAGHTCIYTGSVPAIHGIVGNYWWDNILQKYLYCTDDDSAKTVGSNTVAGNMSPRNMYATTIGDELRLATNFRSKVIGVAIKDRGAILPAGHAANGAYWYDYKTGDFISSTYYNITELPDWAKAFNKKKMVDQLYKLDWGLYLPRSVYPLYCSDDVTKYENQPFGLDQSGFPYKLAKFIGTDYSKIVTTPYGNTLTEAMAEAAVTGEHLGKDKVTDFLAVSFSSTDYIGHAFGPNSWEQLDDYARLDEVLGQFMNFLDMYVGKGNYTLFLTADHGVAHVPLFSKEKNLPGGAFPEIEIVNKMNAPLKEKFGKDHIVRYITNYQVIFNDSLITAAGLDKKAIIKWSIDYLGKLEQVAQAFETKELVNTVLTTKQKEMVANGYFPARSGDIQLILKPGYVEGNGYGSGHGLWNPYDSHIPLLWYGWGIKEGSTNREVYMTDIAATLSAMLHIQMPSGCIGHVIPEVLQ